MNRNIIFSIILNLIHCSTSCNIFPLLNCSCYQSNSDLHFSLPIKIYSHLYCQGNSLTKKTFQSPFGEDFPQQNRFRTISIEFFLQNTVEISSNQFDSLSLLFSLTNADTPMEISIRLNGFNQILFHKQSLTANIFRSNHPHKHLSLHLIPSEDNNRTDLDDQLKFSPNCFSGLIVSQFHLYIHRYKDSFSSLYSFEYIFNNTNIGELHFHGSIIPPGPSSLRRTFKGLVRSLTLHRHVDTIDSHTFPYYFPVYSYNIHSDEAHSMDLQSLISYKNFRGLELLRPRFEVSIDQFIPTLDSLSLDIEYLNARTLLSARHIYHFKLGSRLRRIDPPILYSLSNHLKKFDLSEIDLSEMTSDSRCHLIHFIYQNYHSQIHLILPRTKSLTECDCARLILDEIQLLNKFHEDILCSKQCRFSDCLVISQYFREKYPLFLNDQSRKHLPNEINEDLPSVDFFSDPDDLHMMSFLINQTKEQQININRRRSTTTTTTPLPNTDDISDSINADKEPFNLKLSVSKSDEYDYDIKKSDELDGYLIMDIDKTALSNDPVTCWKAQLQQFPLLSKLAKQFHSIPGTSTSVERQLSAAGLVINE